MKTGSTKSRKDYSEGDVHQWLQGADLGPLAKKMKFKQASFSRLKPTDWNKLYQDFQKSKPISIRLPIRLIDKLKQVSLQTGIAYQSLIRMWVTKNLESFS